MFAEVSHYSSMGGRSNNEDFVSVSHSDTQLLAIVADGLGGYDSGEVASQLAATTIKTELEGKVLNEESLLSAVEKANLNIISQNSENGMKTTVSLVWANNLSNAFFATVGDSRLYHFRDGQIKFQSIDHSVSQMAVLIGEIDASQIRGHKDRNKLIRVLGNKKDVKVDLTSTTLQKDDRLLLCSDGFWENITEDQMLSLMEETCSAQEWLLGMKELLESVMPEDNDNHTAIAVRIL